MNATESPHNAPARTASAPRAAHGAHGAASAAPGKGQAAEGDAPADPFAALLDGLRLPDAQGADTQATSANASESPADGAQAQPAGKPGGVAAQPAVPEAFLAMMMPGAMAATAGQAGGPHTDPLLASEAGTAAGATAHAASASQKHGEAVPDLFLAAAQDVAGKQSPSTNFSAVLAAAGAQPLGEKRHEAKDATAGADLGALTGPAQAAGQPAALTLDASPAAPVHQAAVASHPLDPAFAGDLGAEVQWMVDAGVQQADLHLNPADLGPIRIQLSLTAQTADISFAAAHGATREGITQALPALREMLAQQGLQLGQAGVSGGQGGQQQFAQAQRQAPQARTSNASGAIEATPRARSGSATLRAGRGMLDLYA